MLLAVLDDGLVVQVVALLWQRRNSTKLVFGLFSEKSNKRLELIIPSKSFKCFRFPIYVSDCIDLVCRVSVRLCDCLLDRVLEHVPVRRCLFVVLPFFRTSDGDNHSLLLVYLLCRVLYDSGLEFFTVTNRHVNWGWFGWLGHFLCDNVEIADRSFFCIILFQKFFDVEISSFCRLEDGRFLTDCYKLALRKFSFF